MKYVIALLTFGAALCVSALVSAQASQTTGYVCASRYVALNGPAGRYGHLEVFFNSQPWCGGSQVAHRYYCTAGATSANCASSAYVHATRDSILTLSTQIQSAAQLGNKVVETPVNGKGYYVTFFAN
jgi:hypothetical protein